EGRGASYERSRTGELRSADCAAFLTCARAREPLSQRLAMTTRSTLLLCTAIVAGCANTSGNTSESCSTLTATTPSAMPAWKGSVFTIVMENKSRSDIIGSKSAPFINSLLAQGALAAGYHDSYVH